MHLTYKAISRGDCWFQFQWQIIGYQCFQPPSDVKGKNRPFSEATGVVWDCLRFSDFGENRCFFSFFPLDGICSAWKHIFCLVLRLFRLPIGINTPFFSLSFSVKVNLVHEWKNYTVSQPANQSDCHPAIQTDRQKDSQTDRHHMTDMPWHYMTSHDIPVQTCCHTPTPTPSLPSPNQKGFFPILNLIKFRSLLMCRFQTYI